MLGLRGSDVRERSEKWSVRELSPSTMLFREPYGETLLYKPLFRACTETENNCFLTQSLKDTYTK